jgi:hypothetical protein
VIRIVERQRPQQHRVDYAENCCVRADSQPERQHDDDGEGRSLSKHACAESDVLNQVLDNRDAALLAALLLHLQQTAELDERVPSGLCGRHPRANVVFDVHRQVALEFRRSVGAFAREQLQRAEHPRAKTPDSRSTMARRARGRAGRRIEAHDDSPGVRNRAMISVVRSHSFASFSSCLRPALVNE